MTTETTSTLTNSIRDVYKGKYLVGAMGQRLYDQLAIDYTQLGADGKTMQELLQSTNIYIPFISDMSPGTTAISETQDITPQTLRDATSSITWSSRGEALQWSEKLELSVYTDYTARAYDRVGKNAMESIELLAEAAACQGSWVEYESTAGARASITDTCVATDAIFRQYQAKMLTLKVPGFINDAGEANTWSAIMHPYVFHDIAEGGNVNDIGIYQDKGIHLNFELAQLGPFRLVVSPFAKVFGGAGDDFDTNVATTLASAANALAKTIVTADNVDSDIGDGELWTIGTEETANTFYPTNERIKVLSASTTTLTILGEGPNGGLRFDHDAGAAVRNAYSVYPIIFGGPESLVKVYATDVGEYGMEVGPKVSGTLDQFNTLGWKYYGGYGRVGENRLLRYECGTSYE